MKKILFYLLGIVALSASLSGCSGINRLIKGGDPEAIYAKGVELYDAGKWSKAITLLQNVENYYSGTSKADTLSFYIARAHFKNRSYDTASELFDTYRRTFGRSPFIEDAEGMYANASTTSRRRPSATRRSPARRSSPFRSSCRVIPTARSTGSSSRCVTS